MWYVLFSAWWLLGMAGAFLLWLDWKRHFPEDMPDRCPTRRAALGIFLGGFAGALTLVVGVVVTLIGWLSGLVKRGNFEWWQKPIC